MKTIGHVGLDVHKSTIWAALAVEGVSGSEDLGEISNNQSSIAKLLNRLKQRNLELIFYYEAGPCGYNLYRFLDARGFNCSVIAPSLIPIKPGSRIKNDRKDAANLARFGRAGELVAISVPNREQEAMRELVRRREDAVKYYVASRQQLLSFLLRHDYKYPGKTNWTVTFYRWLEDISFDTAQERIVLQDMVDAVEHGKKRIAILEEQMKTLVLDWRNRPIVDALMSLRGIEMLTAVTIVSEIGDFRRFSNAPAFMNYLGLVPSEYSSGDTRILGKITRTGNGRVRRALVESSWSARHAPYKTKHWKKKAALASEAVQDISYKAMRRTHKRFHALTARRKEPCKVVTAVARELAGFIWAIGIQAQNEMEIGTV